jgi:GntR family histidine utilization transcriptional repressor
LKTQRTVHQNKPQPRYEYVKSHVLNLIEEGQLSPHDRLPSENELVIALGVSRMTVNRALTELSVNGDVVRIAGVGTFVAQALPHSNVMQVRNIADEIHGRGHEHTSKVYKCEEAQANRHLAHEMEIRLGDRVYHSLIMHFESGQPIQMEDRYVDPRFAPEYLQTDFTQTTAYVYLTSCGPVQGAEHIVRATRPTKTMRRRLKMNEGEPCLVIQRRTWSNGSIASYVELTHPGNRFELIGTMDPD